MSEVSVVMSSYREAPAVFCAAADSILAQSFKDFEFVIVLDDPGNAELRALIEGYAEKDARVRPLFNEKNLGLAGSLNAAIATCAARYICRMDADDIARFDRLEKQLSYMEENGLDLVGGNMEVVDDSGSHLYAADKLPQRPESVAKALRWNNSVPHPTWFGERDLFVKGYRAMPLCEDYDFLLRSALAGARLGNYPGTVLSYRMSAGSLSRSDLYEQYLYQRMLTACYAKGRAPEVAEAKEWVAAHMNEARSARYLQANGLFSEAMNLLEQKRYGAVVQRCLRIAATSPAYVGKMFRLVMAARYR